MSAERNDKCTIYKLTNNVNNKVYIGQTWKKDLKRYFVDSHCCKKERRKLYNAIKKYGRENFSIKPIQYCATQNCANECEIYYIKQFNSIQIGYNIKEGGALGAVSDETRALMSKARLGRYGGEKHPMWGKKHSEETKRKIGEKSKGRTPSKETREKISKANLGRKQNQEAIKKSAEARCMFSKEIELQIYNKYLEIKSTRKIAAMFKCNRSVIKRIVCALSGESTLLNLSKGHKNRKPTRKFSFEEAERIRIIYKSNKQYTYTFIAKILNINKHTIKRIISFTGIYKDDTLHTSM